MNHQDESNPELKPVQADFPSIPEIEIIEPIGRGGMAQVFKARQRRLDRIVAVKVLSKATLAGSNGIDRFHQEAKLCSAMDDPVIVKTLAYGLTKNEEPYLIFEYLDGVPLSDEIAKNAPLTFRRFQSIFIPLLSALQKAHAAGIVHRDIKPANIMICENSENPDKPIVKLLDFGIAKLYDEKSLNLTRTGTVVGSPSFMSPEQCQNSSIDGRSDIYSLCCVMYMALSGEAPFKGDSAFDTMLMHVNSPVPTAAEFSSRMEVPIELSKLLLWGLAKLPADRPASAQVFAEKLNQVLNDITLDKAPKVRAAKRNEKQWAFIAAICIVLITVIGLSIFFTSHTTNDQLPAVRIKRNVRESTIARAKQYVTDAHRAKEEGKEEQALALAAKAYNLLGTEYPNNHKSNEFAHQDLAILRGVSSIVEGLTPKKGSFDPGQVFIMMNYDNEFFKQGEGSEISYHLVTIVGSEGSLHSMAWQIHSTTLDLLSDKTEFKSRRFLEAVKHYVELESGADRQVDTAVLHLAELETELHFKKFHEFDKLYLATKKEIATINKDPKTEGIDKINLLDTLSEISFRAGKSEDAVDELKTAFQQIEQLPPTVASPGSASNIAGKLVRLLVANNKISEAEMYLQGAEKWVKEKPAEFDDMHRKEVSDIRAFLNEQKLKFSP